jgi:hypothetical protein
LDHRKYLTTHQAAAALGVPDYTMRKWRLKDPPEGPPFIQLAQRTYAYPVALLEQFMASLRERPFAKPRRPRPPEGDRAALRKV